MHALMTLPSDPGRGRDVLALARKHFPGQNVEAEFVRGFWVVNVAPKSQFKSFDVEAMRDARGTRVLFTPRRSNPIGFVHEHPWMTFFLGLAALSTISSVVAYASFASVAKTLPPAPPPGP